MKRERYGRVRHAIAGLQKTNIIISNFRIFCLEKNSGVFGEKEPVFDNRRLSV